jgi:hypothetical protein
MSDKQQSNPQHWTRRAFLSTTGSTAAATFMAAHVPLAANTSEEARTPGASGPTIEGAVPMRSASTARPPTSHRSPHKLAGLPRESVLPTGTKKGCDYGHAARAQFINGGASHA